MVPLALTVFENSIFSVRASEASIVPHTSRLLNNRRAIIYIYFFYFNFLRRGFGVLGFWGQSNDRDASYKSELV